MIVPLFRIRLIDPVSGAVLVDPLPHPHKAMMTIKAPAPGVTGQSAIGDFTVPLFDPDDPEYMAEAAVYGLIKEGQRIEFYWSTDGNALGGDPFFTGIVRQIPNASNGYQLKGTDSLHLLQLARTPRTEYLNGTTDFVAGRGLMGEKYLWGDETFGAALTGWTRPAGAWTGAVTDESLASVTVSPGNATATMISTGAGSRAAADYQDITIRTWVHATATSTIGSYTRLGILAASDVGAANAILGAIQINNKDASTWEIDLSIQQMTAGALTSKINKTLVFNMPTSTFRGQMQLLGSKGTWNGKTFQKLSTGADYLWRLTVNGVDANCYWVQTATSPSGYAGLYAASNTASGGTGAFGKFVIHNRQNFMQKGALWNTGTKNLAQFFSRTPSIDLLQIAAQTEGFTYRKNPKAGLNNDTIDWGPLAGASAGTPISTDHSLDIRFDGGLNLVDMDIDANADPLASEVELQLSGDASGSGFIEWDSVAAQQVYGVLTDSVTAKNVSDILGARSLADSMLATKSSPGVSKTLSCFWDEDHMGLNGQPRFRVLDYVTVNYPKRKIFAQKVQIMQIAVTEGSREFKMTGDAYPLGDNNIARLWQAVEHLAAGVSSLSPTRGAGVVYDNSYGAPNIMTCYSGYWPVDATHNLIMKFNLPKNVVMVQKVTLSMFLFAWRSSQQSTAVSATSGAGSAHVHTIPALSVNGTTSDAQGYHNHNTPAMTGDSTTHSHNVNAPSENNNTVNHSHQTGVAWSATVYATWEIDQLGNTYYNGGNVGNIWVPTNGESTVHNHVVSATTSDAPSHYHTLNTIYGVTYQATHTHNVNVSTTVSNTAGSEGAHTHTIPSLTLNPPNSLAADSGIASAVHILIDGVDQTANIPVSPGPYSADTLELDITQFIIGGGQHRIELTSATLGGISAQVQAFTLATSI